MSTETASTLEVSDRLEQLDEIAATMSASQKLKSSLQAYFDPYLRTSGNTVLDVKPLIEPEPRPTTKPPVFGLEYSEMIVTAIKELTGIRTLYQSDWEPPTDHAYRVAINLVMDAYFQIAVTHPGTMLPTPFVSTDDSGGIRIAWRFQTRQVRANVGGKSGLRSYIYFQSPAGHDVEPPQAAILANRLYWLLAE